MAKKTFWKISKKITTFEQEKIMKSPKILENLGKFLAFYF
jgi:hypothetical protein